MKPILYTLLVALLIFFLYKTNTKLDHQPISHHSHSPVFEANIETDSSQHVAVKIKKTITPIKPQINHSVKSVPLKSTPPAIDEKTWKGPKSFSLGEESITLKSLEWKVHVTVTLTTDQAKTYRMFAPLRKRMIQMLYFLVSHRADRALQLDDSEERLRKDLSTRLHNVLRNHEFTVDFEHYELEKVDQNVQAWEEHPRYDVGQKQAEHLKWEETTESIPH